ncbi:MAG TPA: hypothetical protein VNW54_02760 [Granulicella sp.]|nr:hypothetical protein [Granulicella sp.]
MVLLALAISLLLVLLTVQGVDPHSVPAVVFLVPIFLFGTVDPGLSLRVIDWLGEAIVPPSPARPVLFGRPPPSALLKTS